MAAGTSIISDEIALHRAHQLHAAAVVGHHRQLGGQEQDQEGRHIVSDYAPGADAEKWLIDTFKAAGGSIAETIKVPLANPDFAPFLQRAPTPSRTRSSFSCRPAKAAPS